MRKIWVFISLLMISSLAWTEPPEPDDKTLYREMAAVFIECSAVWELFGALNAEEQPNTAALFKQIANGAQVAAWHFLALASGDPDRQLGSFKDYTDNQMELHITALAALAENDSDAFMSEIQAKVAGCQEARELQQEIADELRERVFELN